MKTFSFLLLATLLVSCNGSNSSKSNSKKTMDEPILAPVTSTVTPSQSLHEDDKEYAIQITVISFLKGGLESCKVKDELYTFKKAEQWRMMVLCHNSKTEVQILNESGHLTFKAIDLVTDREMTGTDYSSTANTLKLGEETYVRYGFNNPYGFTYIIAEDFTGIDKDLLKQWNTLNDSYSSLKAKIAQAETNNKRVRKKDRRQLVQLEKDLAELAKKMKETKK